MGIPHRESINGVSFSPPFSLVFLVDLYVKPSLSEGTDVLGAERVFAQERFPGPDHRHEGLIGGVENRRVHPASQCQQEKGLI